MIHSLESLKKNVSGWGEVVWIGVRPERKKPVVEQETVEAVAGKGLRGDHFSGFTTGKRGVTLLQFEHLSAIGSFLGWAKPVDPAILRRNIVVRGVNLLVFKDAEFYVGEVKLMGTGLCAPCSRMEDDLGPGGFNAVRGHGGITARILSSGWIRRGDKVGLAC